MKHFHFAVLAALPIFHIYPRTRASSNRLRRSGLRLVPWTGNTFDLQGTWTNATITPLERPKELGDKQFFTQQEAVEYEKQVLDKWDRDRRDGGADADLARAYGSIWWDGGKRNRWWCRAEAHVADDRRSARWPGSAFNA